MCSRNRCARFGYRLAGGAIVLATIALAAREASADDKKPYPLFTAEHFTIAMKTIGQAFTATDGAIARKQADDAKAYLAISRDRLATTITFWRDRNRGDAVKILRDTLSLMDQLDVTLSADQVDAAATANQVKQIGASCQACHQTYRDQDPATKTFRFRNVTQ